LLRLASQSGDTARVQSGACTNTAAYFADGGAPAPTQADSDLWLTVRRTVGRKYEEQSGEMAAVGELVSRKIEIGTRQARVHISR
jgi:hypothetical protein